MQFRRLRTTVTSIPSLQLAPTVKEDLVFQKGKRTIATQTIDFSAAPKLSLNSLRSMRCADIYSKISTARVQPSERTLEEIKIPLSNQTIQQQSTIAAKQQQQQQWSGQQLSQQQQQLQYKVKMVGGSRIRRLEKQETFIVVDEKQEGTIHPTIAALQSVRIE